MICQAVGAENLAAARAFLDRHQETTLFLAASLATYGPRRVASMNSGNFMCLLSGSEIAAVFCLSGRGSILAETGGRADLAPQIVAVCRAEGSPIGGALGEWRAVDSIRRELARLGHVERYHSRERLYRLTLDDARAPDVAYAGVRRLAPGDFERWRPHYESYLAEEGLPVQGTPEQRRVNFEAAARNGCWWGYWQNGALYATVALNAKHQQLGQVGGVYTAPEQRRRGLCRRTMQSMLADCRAQHGLTKLVLFTGQQNVAAQRLYESLGFERCGEFGLYFGADP